APAMSPTWRRRSRRRSGRVPRRRRSGHTSTGQATARSSVMAPRAAGFERRRLLLLALRATDGVPDRQHDDRTRDRADDAAEAQPQAAAGEQTDHEPAEERPQQAGHEALAPVDPAAATQEQLGDPAREQTEHEDAEQEHGPHATRTGIGAPER